MKKKNSKMYRRKFAYGGDISQYMNNHYDNGFYHLPNPVQVAMQANMEAQRKNDAFANKWYMKGMDMLGHAAINAGITKGMGMIGDDTFGGNKGAQSLAKLGIGAAGGLLNGLSYADGGIVPIEAEGGELIQHPGAARALPIRGASHEQGGIDMDVPEGSIIYSRRLKGADGRSMAARKERRDSRERALLSKISKDRSNKVLRDTLRRVQRANAIEDKMDIAYMEQHRRERERAAQGAGMYDIGGSVGRQPRIDITHYSDGHPVPSFAIPWHAYVEAGKSIIDDALTEDPAITAREQQNPYNLHMPSLANIRGVGRRYVPINPDPWYKRPFEADAPEGYHPRVPSAGGGGGGSTFWDGVDDAGRWRRLGEAFAGHITDPYRWFWDKIKGAGRRIADDGSKTWDIIRRGIASSGDVGSTSGIPSTIRLGGPHIEGGGIGMGSIMDTIGRGINSGQEWLADKIMSGGGHYTGSARAAAPGAVVTTALDDGRIGSIMPQSIKDFGEAATNVGRRIKDGVSNIWHDIGDHINIGVPSPIGLPFPLRGGSDLGDRIRKKWGVVRDNIRQDEQLNNTAIGEMRGRQDSLDRRFHNTIDSNERERRRKIDSINRVYDDRNRDAAMQHSDDSNAVQDSISKRRESLESLKKWRREEGARDVGMMVDGKIGPMKGGDASSSKRSSLYKVNRKYWNAEKRRYDDIVEFRDRRTGQVVRTEKRAKSRRDGGANANRNKKPYTFNLFNRDKRAYGGIVREVYAYGGVVRKRYQTGGKARTSQYGKGSRFNGPMSSNDINRARHDAIVKTLRSWTDFATPALYNVVKGVGSIFGRVPNARVKGRMREYKQRKDAEYRQEKFADSISKLKSNIEGGKAVSINKNNYYRGSIAELSKRFNYDKNGSNITTNITNAASGAKNTTGANSNVGAKSNVGANSNVGSKGNVGSKSNVGSNVSASSNNGKKRVTDAKYVNGKLTYTTKSVDVDPPTKVSLPKGGVTTGVDDGMVAGVSRVPTKADISSITKDVIGKGRNSGGGGGVMAGSKPYSFNINANRYTPPTPEESARAQAYKDTDIAYLKKRYPELNKYLKAVEKGVGIITVPPEPKDLDPKLKQTWMDIIADPMNRMLQRQVFIKKPDGNIYGAGDLTGLDKQIIKMTPGLDSTGLRSVPYINFGKSASILSPKHKQDFIGFTVGNTYDMSDGGASVATDADDIGYDGDPHPIASSVAPSIAGTAGEGGGTTAGGGGTTTGGGSTTTRVTPPVSIPPILEDSAPTTTKTTTIGASTMPATNASTPNTTSSNISYISPDSLRSPNTGFSTQGNINTLLTPNNVSKPPLQANAVSSGMYGVPFPRAVSLGNRSIMGGLSAGGGGLRLQPAGVGGVGATTTGTPLNNFWGNMLSKLKGLGSKGKGEGIGIGGGGDGDIFGSIGNALGNTGVLYNMFAPQRTTDEYFKGVPPFTNYYANYGNNARKDYDSGFQALAGSRDNALNNLRYSQNTQFYNIDNDVRSINTANALKLAAMANINRERSNIITDYGNKMADLYRGRADLDNNIDNVVMGGERAADLANRDLREQYYNALGQNRQSFGTGLQQLGKNYNDIARDNYMRKLMQSKYGNFSLADDGTLKFRIR